MSSSGALNKIVVLQYPTKTSDPAGGAVLTWNNAATAWAAIWPVSAAELTRAESVSMVISHRIRIRYRSVVKGSWRVKFGLRYFSIISIVNPNEKNEWLDLLCKEAA